jgi:transcription initiation factor IIE alpha subunit
MTKVTSYHICVQCRARVKSAEGIIDGLRCPICHGDLEEFTKHLYDSTGGVHVKIKEDST